MDISLMTHGAPNLLDSSAAAASTPSDVANLAHWYDPSVLSSLYQDSAQTTPVASDGDPVGSFVCQVVSADDVTQATSANKPTYRAAVASLNNKPALEFDGTDYLQGAFSATLSQPNTIFVVAIMSDVVTNRATTGGDDSAHRHAIVAFTNTNYRLIAGANLDGGTPDTNAHILTAVFNTTSSALYVDGVSVASGNAGTHTLDGLTIGAVYIPANFFAGSIADHLIYDADLSAADKNIVQNYLATKYGVSVTEFA